MTYRNFALLAKAKGWTIAQLRCDEPASDDIIGLMDSLGLSKYERYVTAYEGHSPESKPPRRKRGRPPGAPAKPAEDRAQSHNISLSPAVRRYLAPIDPSPSRAARIVLERLAAGEKTTSEDPGKPVGTPPSKPGRKMPRIGAISF